MSSGRSIEKALTFDGRPQTQRRRKRSAQVLKCCPCFRLSTCILIAAHEALIKRFNQIVGLQATQVQLDCLIALTISFQPLCDVLQCSHKLAAQSFAQRDAPLGIRFATKKSATVQLEGSMLASELLHF